MNQIIGFAFWIYLFVGMFFCAWASANDKDLRRASASDQDEKRARDKRE